MKCKPKLINASSFADSVSMNSFSFAVIVSQKMRQMRAEPVSNASYYTYTIKLASTKNDWMPILSFDYPDDIQREWAAYHLRKTQVVQTNTMPATGQNLAALDFNYNLSGDNPSWKPVRIYTDGIKTYIQFPSTHFNESPALLSLGNSGDEELVNYRLIGDRYVVDKVLDRAALIVGVGLSQTKVEIIRKEGSK